MSIDRLTELARNIDEAKAVYLKEGKDIFKDAAREFLLANKDHIAAIVWNQFTPYFNDGDPCVFRIGDIYFVKPNGFDPNDLESSSYSYSEKAYDVYSKDFETKDLEKEVKVFDKLINDHEFLMENMFYDHVTVFLYLNDEDKLVAETQEYDHD